LKRIIAVLRVAALMAVMMVAGAGNAFALPYNEQGTFTDQAVEGCLIAVGTQFETDVETGGGPKEGVLAPTNCDHYFQYSGAIGQPNYLNLQG
jgi:hypothetical protein